MPKAKDRSTTRIAHPITNVFLQSDEVRLNSKAFLRPPSVAYKLFEQEMYAVERSNPVPAPLTERQLGKVKRVHTPCPTLARVPVMDSANWAAYTQKVYDLNCAEYAGFKQHLHSKPLDPRLRPRVLTGIPQGYGEKWNGAKGPIVQMEYYRRAPMAYVMPGALGGLCLNGPDFKPFARFMLDVLMRLRDWDNGSGPGGTPSNDVFASLVVGCLYQGSNPAEVRTDINEAMTIIGAVYCAMYTTWSPQPLACTKLSYPILGRQIVSAMLGMRFMLAGKTNGYGAEYDYYVNRAAHQGNIPTWDSIEPLWLDNDAATAQALQARFDTLVRVIPQAADLKLRISAGVVAERGTVLTAKSRAVLMSAVCNCFWTKQAKAGTDAAAGTGYYHLRNKSLSMNCVTGPQAHVRDKIISEPLVHSPFHWTREVK